MKTTSKDIKAINALIEIHIRSLRKEKETKHTRYRAAARKWKEIQKNLNNEILILTN